MTLHEAIIKVLQQAGRSMTTREIADALNSNKWYIKDDKSLIATSQISARIAKYPELFTKNGSQVSIKSDSQSIIRNIVPKSEAPIANYTSTQDELSDELKLKILMNEKNFRSAGIIDKIVPDEPGLYCIRIKDPSQLPAPFGSYLTERGHNILYIGIAATSLKKRFLGQELRAKGHGTFFRGMGAVLGYRPCKGSLNNYVNKKNYRFSVDDEQSIIKWVNSNLLINWVVFNGNYGETENLLIREYSPLLNTDKNPLKLPELAALRRECRNIANNN
jgi:hypothetical protein